MLRHQYNYLLADRFRWWKYNRCNLIIPQGEYCLRWCEIGTQELRDNPDWHSQSASLPMLKQLRRIPRLQRREYVNNINLYICELHLKPLSNTSQYKISHD